VPAIGDGHGGEHKPFEEIYVEEFGSTIGIRKNRRWWAQKQWQNWQLDFTLQDYTLYCEVQGAGEFSHTGSGATRDYKKHNALTLLGYVGFYYRAQEILDHPQIICEEIYDYWKENFDA
jgi:very-short-patch-repair endonuclease